MPLTGSFMLHGPERVVGADRVLHTESSVELPQGLPAGKYTGQVGAIGSEPATSPTTFVPRTETYGGLLPRLTWEPVSGIEPLTCRLQDGCSAY